MSRKSRHIREKGRFINALETDRHWLRTYGKQIKYTLPSDVFKTSFQSTSILSLRLSKVLLFSDLLVRAT